MSYETKLMLLSRIENGLSADLSKIVLDQTIDKIKNILNEFDVKFTGEKDTNYTDYLNPYLNALRIEGKSKGTLYQYERMIHVLMRSLQIPTSDITIYHLRDFLAKEKERGLADTTIRGERDMICSYFKWIWHENMIPNNPAANLGKVKISKRMQESLSETDLDKLKDACTNIRDIAIILFLGSTGCRISEITSLNKYDINFDRMEVRVIGKGDKERVAYFDELTLEYLRRYLDSRKDNEPALFLNKRHKRLNPGGVRFMLKTLEQKTGVHKVHPHKFRRTLATNLAARGMPIQEIAAILGHEKIETTMKYVNVKQDDVKYSYRKYNS